MLSATERKEKIAAIRRLPDQIDGAVKGLTDPQHDVPYRVGGWTIRQVVHHLADSHMNAFVRTKLILTEDHPLLKPYDQDAWAKLPDTLKTPIACSLSIVRGIHERWVTLLEQVPEAGWGRAAMHPERGEMTLEDLLITYSGHGEKHVGHVKSLRVARGW